MKAKQKKLTIKQRKFVEAVVETGNRAQAARIAWYKCKDNRQAASVWYENMIKPYINDEVEDRLKIAKDKIFYLAQFAEKEEIQFKASQDIADRVEGKPTQKIITEGSLNVNMDITKLSDEELDKILRTPRN